MEKGEIPFFFSKRLDVQRLNLFSKKGCYYWRNRLYLYHKKEIEGEKKNDKN